MNKIVNIGDFVQANSNFLKYSKKRYYMISDIENNNYTLKDDEGFTNDCSISEEQLTAYFILNVNNQVIEEIINAAKEVFCNGLYVPADEHPCGWDFISFEGIYMGLPEKLPPYEYRFTLDDISNGIYSSHAFADKTLFEILKTTKNKYAFEESGMDW